MSDQLFLFPEHNHFDQKINDLHFIDLHYLPEIINPSYFRTNFKWNWLEKKQFFLFKTGGINMYMQDLGPIFPYIIDTKTNKIKKIRTKTGELYPRVSFEANNKTYKPYVHAIVARAFVTNPHPDKFDLVHHVDNNPVDYRPANLRHVNNSLNQKGVKRTVFGNKHDNYLTNDAERTQRQK